MRSRPLLLKATIAGLASAAVLLGTVVAPAQTFVGVGLADRPVPGQPPARLAAVAPLPVAPTSPTSLVAPTVLRFFPGTLDGLRLTGEIGDLRWPVYLTSAQAAASLRIRVGYLSAVSVLPDASLLDVRVNDRSVGSDAIDAAQGLRSIVFAIPAGLLKPGYNAVSITVQQRHRVDCSVAATYELWSKIEASATGLELPQSVGSITEIGDLPALLPDADGSMPIHVLLAGKTNPSHVQRLIRVTQEVALRGRFLQPSLSFSELPANPYGVNLALGTRAALSQLPRFSGMLESEGPLVKLIPASVVGRPTLLITGSTDAEVDRAIASLGLMPPTEGSPAGLLAAANYPALKAGDHETLKLRTFGVDSQDFTGRFFRKSINVELPADILASDYGRTDLIALY